MNPEHEVREILSKLYPNATDARRVASDSGFDENKIDFAGSSENVWYNIFRYGIENGKLSALLNYVLINTPDSPHRRIIENFSENCFSSYYLSQPSYTVRDIILGALFSINSLWIRRPNQITSDEAARDTERWEELFFRLMLLLINQIDNVDEIIPSSIYGFPSWLHTDGHITASTMLHDIAEALDNPDVISDPVTKNALLRVCSSLKAANAKWSRGNGPGNDFLFLLLAKLGDGIASTRYVIDRRAQPWPDINRDESGLHLAARDGRTALQEQNANLASLEAELLATDPILHPNKVASLAESFARYSRFDIPLCDTTLPRGMVLGARLISTKDHTVGIPSHTHRDVFTTDFSALLKLSPGWKPIDSEFEQGVAEGIAAARLLLRQIAPEISTLFDMTINLFGIFPPTTVGGRSAGLPVALEYLRTALDLPHGPYAASGVLELKQRSGLAREIESHAIKPLNELSQRGKSAAVREDGYRVALLCCGDNERVSVQGVIRLPHPAGLIDAAYKMWDGLFAEKIDLRRRDWLRPAGFIPNWRDAEDSKMNMYVSTQQADILYKAIVALNVSSTQQNKASLSPDRPEVYYLSAPARTGKTEIAKEVRDRLITDNWSVAFFSVRQMAAALNTFSDPSVFERLVKKEASLLRLDARRIIIIDGIEYDERIIDLDEHLRDISSRLNVYFLVVRRSDNFSAWNSPPGRTFNAIAGIGALKEFARRLTAPDCVPQSRINEIEAAAESRDLGWLVDVASGVSPEARIRDLVLQSNETDRSRLKQLAYTSYWGVGTPSALLDGIGGKTREALRPYLVVDTQSRSNSALIPSRHVAKAMIDALDPQPTGRTSLPSLGEAERRLAQVLDHSMKVATNSGEVVDVDALIEVCWRLSSGSRPGRLARRLFTKDRSREITQLAQHNLIGRSAMLTLFESVSNHLYIADAITILARIMIRCRQELNDNVLSCSDFHACLDALYRNRGLLGSSADETGQASALDKAWMDIKSTIQSKLVSLLRDEPVPREHFALIRRLLSFRDYEIDVHVASAVRSIISAPGKDFSTDTFYILRMLDVGARLRLIIDGTEGDDRTIKDWARGLIVRATPDLTDFSFLSECRLEQLRLRLNLIAGDWRDYHDVLHQRLLAALNGARMDDVIAGFGGIHREQPGYLAKYLNDRRLFGHTFILNQSHGAGAIADLASGLSKWHAESAFELFYSSSELRPQKAAKPNRTRAEAFASTIRSQRDGRNAGRLILAAAKIDLMYNNTGAGFSDLLVERVGIEFFRTQFDSEERSSILFYLVEGLLFFHHSFFEDLFSRIVLHLERAVEKGFHPWAARLAFRLCLDAQFGARARERLQEIIERHSERVLESMLDSTDPDAICALFGLAVLDKREGNGLAEQFAKRINEEDRWSDLIGVLARRSRPDLVVTALRAVDATLRRAGRGREGSRFLERAAAHRSLYSAHLRGTQTASESRAETGVNFTELRESIKWRVGYIRAADAEDTAALLDQLRLFNPGLARATLRRHRVFSPLTRTGILSDKIKRLERSPGQVVRLLSSADAILAGTGRHLLAIFVENNNRARLLREEIQFIQNPRTFAIVSRLLIKFHYKDVDKINSTFVSVWSKSDIVGSLRSAAALTELMELAAALDRYLEQEGNTSSSYYNGLADNIDIKSLEKRFIRPNSWDMDFFPTLIYHIFNSGRKDGARVLLRRIATIDITSMTSIAVWARMLACFLALDEETPARMVEEMDNAAKQLLTAPMALDDLAKWREFVVFAAVRELVRGESSEAERIAFANCPISLRQIPDPGLQFLILILLRESFWSREMAAKCIHTIKSSPGLVSIESRAWLNVILGLPIRMRPDISVDRWENSGRPLKREFLHRFIDLVMNQIRLHDSLEE